jgi:hypothetical protein
MKKLPRTLGWSIKFLIVCTLGACAPYSSMCTEEMDCRGGNDADIDACVISYEQNEELSSLHNCTDLWDRYIDCRLQQVHCSSKNWTDDGDCNNEWKDYSDCVN